MSAETFEAQLSAIHERLAEVGWPGQGLPVTPSGWLAPAVLPFGRLRHCPKETLLSLVTALELLWRAHQAHLSVTVSDGSRSDDQPSAIVLVGDYLFATASVSAASTGSLPAMRAFSDLLMSLCSGSLTRIFNASTGVDGSPPDQAVMLSGSLRAAGLLCGATDSEMVALREYGLALGHLFALDKANPRACKKRVADFDKLKASLAGRASAALETLPSGPARATWRALIPHLPPESV